MAARSASDTGGFRRSSSTYQRGVEDPARRANRKGQAIDRASGNDTTNRIIGGRASLSFCKTVATITRVWVKYKHTVRTHAVTQHE